METTLGIGQIVETQYGTEFVVTGAGKCILIGPYLRLSPIDKQLGEYECPIKEFNKEWRISESYVAGFIRKNGFKGKDTNSLGTVYFNSYLKKLGV